MRALLVEARGFRNLVDLALELPPAGAVFLGPNGHGKTNLLEALYYPVLFRSLRGARDVDLVRWDHPAFHVRIAVSDLDGSDRIVEGGFAREGRRKRLAVDGSEPTRLTDAIGAWLAVAFLPGDVSLVSGGARERRQYLDRVLSLDDRAYLLAARRYRAALEQRNAALRQRQAGAARAFDAVLAEAGAAVTRRRVEWVRRFGPRWAELCAELGEPMAVRLEYRGRQELADPTAWPPLLDGSLERDLTTGASSIGPHRDDVALRLGRSPLRDAGSTGQHRTAAIALKLCERETLAGHTEPALLLDDVFSELDRERQCRLAQVLEDGAARQVFVTSPRRDELPPGLDLPIFALSEGRVTSETGRALR